MDRFSYSFLSSSPIVGFEIGTSLTDSETSKLEKRFANSQKPIADSQTLRDDLE
jgi:hypothetical protein